MQDLSSSMAVPVELEVGSSVAVLRHQQKDESGTRENGFNVDDWRTVLMIK